MTRLYLTIICIAILSINVYSQRKADVFEKVSIADFSVNGDKSVCLWYDSVISFPYAYSDKDCGAKDYLFSVKNETHMRILLNRNDTSSMFLAIHTFYNARPKVISASCYYLNNKDAIIHEIIDSRIKFVYYFDKGFFFDLSSINGHDDNVIIDLKYSYPIESKKVIKLFLDNKLDYKFIDMRLDIPEIYSYKIIYSQNYFIVKSEKSVRGPIIGWISTKGTSYENFHTKNFYNSMPKSITSPDGNTIYFYPTIAPVTCNIKPVTINSQEFISTEGDDTEENFNAIVTFTLLRINEIL